MKSHTSQPQFSMSHTVNGPLIAFISLKPREVTLPTQNLPAIPACAFCLMNSESACWRSSSGSLLGRGTPANLNPSCRSPSKESEKSLALRKPYTQCGATSAAGVSALVRFQVLDCASFTSRLLAGPVVSVTRD